MNRREARNNASASSSESASTWHTNGNLAMFTAAFMASARPPFSLSTTVRLGWRSERNTRRTDRVSSLRR
jgi:hypothetical protein